MSTRATSNQFSWRQFTERELEKRECEVVITKGRDHGHDDYNEVETPRRSTRNKNKNKDNSTSTNTVVEQQKKTSKKQVTVKTIAATASTAATATAAASQKSVAFETTKSIRTRAQRRLADAVDAIVQLQDTPEPGPVLQKAGRRAEYWVKRDDKRRQSARLLKIQSHE